MPTRPRRPKLGQINFEFFFSRGRVVKASATPKRQRGSFGRGVEQAKSGRKGRGGQQGQPGNSGRGGQQGQSGNSGRGGQQSQPGSGKSSAKTKAKKPAKQPTPTKESLDRELDFYYSSR